MSEDFILVNPIIGKDVLISKSSISSIKQKRTQAPKTLTSNGLIDDNYDYIEITLKELNVDGYNVTVEVKSSLDAFIRTYLS